MNPSPRAGAATTWRAQQEPYRRRRPFDGWERNLSARGHWRFTAPRCCCEGSKRGT